VKKTFALFFQNQFPLPRIIAHRLTCLQSK
jgi:hypothetical protein